MWTKGTTIWSRYTPEYSAEIKEWVIWSWIPYYLEEENYSITDQVKSMVDCLIRNVQTKKK